MSRSISSHYNRGKVKRRAQSIVQKVKISKTSVMSLLILHHNLFLKQLLKAANEETRHQRSKITKGEHVKAVAARILRKHSR
ncbi:hypothetical protein PoB_002155000 [Plakobranchus ocellatus]|uniref:Centromere protein W n=1 Tax=Plakobranchus ocellatus TaxID=259542 RepID=A0AAV3ZHE8_9GAST|nr:hypothetical protein PoB_002155000 [Plakobranchus ocellatus]